MALQFEFYVIFTCQHNPLWIFCNHWEGKNILSLWAVYKKQAVSWIWPVDYCLPTPGLNQWFLILTVQPESLKMIHMNQNLWGWDPGIFICLKLKYSKAKPAVIGFGLEPISVPLTL